MPTYYVRSSGGSDANDGLSFAAGWATVQYAMDTAVAGDIVLVCADGTHLPTATIDIDTNLGTAFSPIVIRGASATGTDDGTVATISGASLGAGTSLINLNLNTNIMLWEGLRFTAGKLYNISQPTGGNFTFHNCRIDTAANHGIYCTVSSGQQLDFENCEIDSNGGAGHAINSNGRGRSSFFNCSIHDNVSHGVLDSPQVAGLTFPVYDSCLIYDNGGDGINLLGAATYAKVVINHCVIFGNTGDGLDAVSTIGKLFIKNSIFRSNGGYGINLNGGGVKQFAVCKYICSHNNTSGHININSGVLPGTGHVLEDPQFVSETDGSENFTPANVNLLKAIALPRGGTSYEYIGAIQRTQIVPVIADVKAGVQYNTGGYGGTLTGTYSAGFFGVVAS